MEGAGGDQPIHFNQRDVKLLLKYPLFSAGAMVIMLVLVIALLGSFIRPDASQHASRQNQSLSKLPPFSSVSFLKVRMNKPKSSNGLRKRIKEGGIENDFIYYPYEDLQVIENEIKIIFKKSSFSFLLADVVYPLDGLTLRSLKSSESKNFNFIDLDNNGITINSEGLEQKVLNDHIVRKTFWFGTDALGRDVLSRLMAGSAISLSVGFFSVCVSILIGLVVGLLAGYYGGWVDRILNWNMNLFWSVPAILLVVSVTIALGTGTQALIVGIALVLWVEMAQVVRNIVQSIRLKDFVLALRLMGLSHLTILFRHILPNLIGPIAVLASTSFAEAIMLEAGLSFLGNGIQPPQPSWGNMIRDSYGYIISGDSAFLAIIPSVSLIVLILSFVFVSDGLKQMNDLVYNQSQRGTV